MQFTPLLQMNSELNALFTFNFEYQFQVLPSKCIIVAKKIFKAKTAKERITLVTKWKSISSNQRPEDLQFFCIILTFAVCVKFDEEDEETLSSWFGLIQQFSNEKYYPYNLGLLGYYIKFTDIFDNLSTNKGINYPDTDDIEFQLFCRFLNYQKMRLQISLLDFDNAELSCKKGLSISTKHKQFQTFLGFGVVICWFKGKFFLESFLDQHFSTSHCIRVLNFYIKNMEYSNALGLLESYADEFNKYGLYLLLLYNLKYICFARVLHKFKLQYKEPQQFEFKTLREFWPECWDDVALIQAFSYLFGGKIIMGLVYADELKFDLISTEVSHHILLNNSKRGLIEKEPSECLQKMLLLKDPDVFELYDLENDFLNKYDD